MNGFEFNDLVEQLTDHILPIVTNITDVFDIGGVRSADWMVLTEQEFLDIVAVLETAVVVKGNGKVEQLEEALKIANEAGTDANTIDAACNHYTELVDVALALIPGRNDEHTYWIIEFHDDEDDWDN